MALRNPGTTASNALEERIRQHRREMARRQPDQRDPAQELGALLREEIGLAALQATYEEYRQNKFSWLEDDGGFPLVSLSPFEARRAEESPRQALLRHQNRG